MSVPGVTSLPSMTSTAIAESSAAGGGAFHIGASTGPFGFGAGATVPRGPLGIDPIWWIAGIGLTVYLINRR